MIEVAGRKEFLVRRSEASYNSTRFASKVVSVVQVSWIENSLIVMSDSEMLTVINSSRWSLEISSLIAIEVRSLLGAICKRSKVDFMRTGSRGLRQVVGELKTPGMSASGDRTLPFPLRISR